MGRTRKPRRGKAKKISYALIDKHSDVGKPMYALLTELVRAFHEELDGAQIALAWCTSWKTNVDGQVTLGKCQKASDLHRELAPFDFVILLNRDFWTNLRTTAKHRRALLDHELCVPPWTRVSGPEREAAITRWYTGQLVRIRTALGYELSVTENHPVLTPRGFVRADALMEGEDVFCAGWREREAPRVDPHVGEMEPTIEQVARTSRLISTLMPKATEDFNAKIAVHEVDIPGTDGELVATWQSELRKQVSHLALRLRNRVLVPLASERRFLKAGHRVSLTSPGPVRDIAVSSRQFGVILRALRLRFRERAQFDPEPTKPFAYDGRRYATLPCEVTGRRTALIALDQIIGIVREPYRGHVYNLQTAASWFAANGIVTHNCHATVKYASNGEPEIDERGRKVYRIRKHDLEEFAVIGERYGCWKGDIEQFAQALARSGTRVPGYFIGVQRLQALLAQVGEEIPREVLASWSQTKRLEAEEWALLRIDVGKDPSLAANEITTPAHIIDWRASSELPFQAEPSAEPAPEPAATH